MESYIVPRNHERGNLTFFAAIAASDRDNLWCRLKSQFLILFFFVLPSHRDLATQSST